MDETSTTSESTNEDIIVQESEQENVTQEETQTTSEYNQLYSEQIDLTNHLISGQIFFMGLIFGAIIFKIFWERWKI